MSYDAVRYIFSHLYSKRLDLVIQSDKEVVAICSALCNIPSILGSLEGHRTQREEGYSPLQKNHFISFTITHSEWKINNSFMERNSKYEGRATPKAYIIILDAYRLYSRGWVEGGMIDMGSINANMGVPRTGLLVACLVSSGRLQIFTSRYSSLTHCSQCTEYIHELDPRGQIVATACQ